MCGQIGTGGPIDQCHAILIWACGGMSISFWLPSILTPLPGEFEEAESTSYFASFLLKLGYSISTRFWPMLAKTSRASRESATASHFLEQLYLWCQRPSMMILVDKLQGLPLSSANRGARLVL